MLALFSMGKEEVFFKGNVAHFMTGFDCLIDVKSKGMSDVEKYKRIVFNFELVGIPECRCRRMSTLAHHLLLLAKKFFSTLL
mgnify:FL=1